MRYKTLIVAQHYFWNCLWGYVFTAFCCSTVVASDKSVTIDQSSKNAVPFSLAISGGISLGSYEAGLNWALIRYLKSRRDEISHNENDRLPPELMSSVGASAGSINALISAINWCVDDSRFEQVRPGGSDLTSVNYGDTIDHNLFRSLWLNAGIDEMLPADKDTYRAGDGLLTRSAFDASIKQIIKILKSDIFRADCNLPIGMTVTRVDPVKMSIAGVEVENQRFMIPVSLQSAVGEGRHGQIEIVSKLVSKDDPYLGNVMYLRESDQTSAQRNTIKPEHLIDAILTSSAYPVAFSKIELPHCASQGSNDEAANDKECPSGYYPRIDAFIDGGVFDNVPLGIAKALAEPREHDFYSRERWQNSARPYNYVYIDPDTRRSVTKHSAETATDSKQSGLAEDSSSDFMAAGIRKQFKFLGGAIATGRHYELYNVLRGGDWNRHSYEFSCQLLNIISDDSNQERNCYIEHQPPQNRCHYLLKDRLDRQHKLNQAERVMAASCLLLDALKLERIYYGYHGVGASAESIVATRVQLLSRLETLARQSGQTQLALSIAAARMDKLGDRRILLTRRFAPITGAMLGAFGAFVDRPFRDYDYYAGVYDAVYGLADFLCKQHSQYQLCLAKQTERIYLKLNIPSSADANTVFYLLATHEHPDFRQQTSPWQWLAASVHFKQLPQGNMPTIFSALAHGFDRKHHDVYTEPEFTDFIQLLFAAGYDTRHSSNFMKRVYRLKDKDPKTWYYPITSRISARMLELEQESEDEYAPLVRGALGLGAFAVHSFIVDEEHKLLIQSAAPADSWMTWLPYEIGADFRNGGLVVSWLPGVDLSDNLSLDLKVTPAHLNRFAGETIWFSQADLYLSYQRSGIISSFGIGPTYTYSWKDWPGAKQNNVGASVYLAMLQDKLRLTIGSRSFRNSDFAGESVYFSISVMDIPGFVYWLTKGN